MELAIERRPIRPPRPSPRSQLVLFLLTFVVLIALAAKVTFEHLLFAGDALSRTYSAATVLYASHPALANIGFVWPPLPALLQVPLALYRPLLTNGFTGNIVSAIAGAVGLVMMNAILARFVPNLIVRFALLLVYQCNVMILWYSVNGMSEILLVAISLICWYAFQTLYDHFPSGRCVAQVAAMGMAAGMAFLSNLQGAPFGLAIFVALLIVLVANGRRLALFRGLMTGGHEAVRREETLMLEGYSLAYLTPYVYAIFLWLFFNWMIMGDPLFFVSGGYALYAPQRTLVSDVAGNIFGAARYAAIASAIIFPAFYLTQALLLVQVVRNRDAFALSLAVTAMSTPVFQTVFSYAYFGPGDMRYYMYMIPFSIIGLAYVLSAADISLKAGVRHAVLVLIVALSSIATLYGVSRTDILANPQGEFTFAKALLNNEIVDNTYFERQAAQHLAKLPLDKKILIDDLVGDHIILFTMQFERFITTRDANFGAYINNPIGNVDYIMVPRGTVGRNLMIQHYLSMYENSAPYLELEREFPGASYPWRLYRVIDPRMVKE